MNVNLQYAERVYNVLLSLYPVRFRVRFAPEMAQLFRDCCHDALKNGEGGVLAAFLVSALRDLFVSILRERRSELMGPLNIDHPIIGIIDRTLIPSIVTVNLVVLGPVLTLLVGGDVMPVDQFMMTSGFFSVAIGSLAVVASVVITRLRPTVRLWVKLSA